MHQAAMLVVEKASGQMDRYDTSKVSIYNMGLGDWATVPEIEIDQWQLGGAGNNREGIQTEGNKGDAPLKTKKKRPKRRKKWG